MNAATFGLTVVACGPLAGPSWSEAFDTSDFGGMFGVWGSGPDDVFMVGGEEERAHVMHYDGDAWQSMDVPEVPALIWIYGFGPADVYAVGLGGAVLHYDGDAWGALSIGTQQDLWGVFGFEPGDLWIVGGSIFGDFPLIARYDGEEFRAVDVSQSENAKDARALFKVWGIDGELFAVGQSGQVLRWDGELWRNSPMGELAEEDFVSLWGTARDEIVLVGGRTRGQIATYDGEAWHTRTPSGVPGLNGVHVAEPGVAMIGGVGGFVARYDVRSRQLSPESQDVTDVEVHALWGDGAGRTYAAAGDFFPPFTGAALVRSEPVR